MQKTTKRIYGVNVVSYSTDNGDLLCRVWDRGVIQIADRFHTRIHNGHTSYLATSRKSALRVAPRLAALLEK